MADAHAHDDEHGDDYLVHSHITSIKTYLVIFGALIFLTFLTVLAYNVRLGELNLFVAVLIAMVKSSLVGAYFMHLKYEKKFNILFFVGSLIFVGVFLAYTLNDTDRRGEESVQGLRIDPATGNYAYGTANQLGIQGEFTPFPPNMVPSEEGEENEAEEAAPAAAEEAPAEAAPAEEAVEEAAEESADETEEDETEEADETEEDEEAAAEAPAEPAEEAAAPAEGD